MIKAKADPAHGRFGNILAGTGMTGLPGLPEGVMRAWVLVAVGWAMTMQAAGPSCHGQETGPVAWFTVTNPSIGGRPLDARNDPAWALVLAERLPATTTMMLKLDRLHRAANPLGNRMAAEIRLAVADSLGCRYGAGLARADLERALNAGATDTDADGKPSPASATDALEPATLELVRLFARHLTVAAHEIDDDEFDRVFRALGAERTVAVVHSAAYANFQCRLLLGLGMLESTGSMDVPDDPPRREVPGSGGAPDRPPWESVRSPANGTRPGFRPDWDPEPQAGIESRLELQRVRRGRIPDPPEESIERLPEPAREQARKIEWCAISMGYQPELSAAWLETMRAFQQEAKLDRVFSNSLFWVITRTNGCFY
jgi:hypothetical protein